MQHAKDAGAGRAAPTTQLRTGCVPSWTARPREEAESDARRAHRARKLSKARAMQQEASPWRGLIVLLYVACRAGIILYIHDSTGTCTYLPGTVPVPVPVPVHVAYTHVPVITATPGTSADLR